MKKQKDAFEEPESTGKELAVIDATRKELMEAGFDYNSEMDDLRAGNTTGLSLPRINIDHAKHGPHRLLIDFGESYDDSQQIEEINGAEFSGVIFAYQNIRALWTEGEKFPICSGVNGVVDKRIKSPVHPQCEGCPQSIIGIGKCKAKVRLWLLIRRPDGIKPFIFALPPTSIKHWRLHLRKLERTNLPVIAFNTRFGLTPVEKNSYKWAEASIGVDGPAPKDMLVVAKQAREELKRILETLSDKDFSDPGDRVRPDQEEATDAELDEVFPTAEEVRNSEAVKTMPKTGVDFLDKM